MANKAELIKTIAGKLEGVNNKEAGVILEAVLTSIEEGLVNEGEVNIAGFAKFTLADTPAKTARNPKTGEPVPVPAGKKVKFKALKGLKDAVAGK